MSIVLTENAKTIAVNYDALKPAYDSAYKIAVKEPETTSPAGTETPATTAPPVVTTTPEVTVTPSVKPVQKKQKIIVAKTTYKKAHKYWIIGL